MRSSPLAATIVLAANTAIATALAQLCTVANIQAALPANGTLNSINFLTDTVTVSPLYNITAAVGTWPSTSRRSPVTYCNVTVSYSRPGKTAVTLLYASPSPNSLLNRFYVAGGSGYTLSSSAIGSLSYGTVSGATSAGDDAFM